MDIRKGMKSQSNMLEASVMIKSYSKPKKIFQSQQQNLMISSQENRQSTPDLQMVREKKARLLNEMTELRSQILARSKYEINESRLAEKIFQFLYANYADIFGFKEIVDKLHSLVFSDSPSQEPAEPRTSELPSIAVKNDTYGENVKLLRDLFTKERGESKFEKEFDHKMIALVSSYCDAGKNKTLDQPKREELTTKCQVSSQDKIPSFLQKNLSGSKSNLNLPRKSLIHYRKSEGFKSFLLMQLGRNSQTGNDEQTSEIPRLTKIQTGKESYDIERQKTETKNQLFEAKVKQAAEAKTGKENILRSDMSNDHFSRRKSVLTNRKPSGPNGVTFKDLCSVLQQQCAVLEVKNRELKRKNKTLTQQLKSIKDDKNDMIFSTEGLRKFAELERKVAGLSKEKFEMTQALLKASFDAIERKKQLKDMQTTSVDYLRLAERERRMRENTIGLCQEKENTIKMLQLAIDKLTVRTQDLEHEKVSQNKQLKEMFGTLVENIESNLRDELLLTRLRNESMQVLKDSANEISDEEVQVSHRNSSYEKRNELPELQDIVNIKTRYSDSPSSEYRRKMSRVNDQSASKTKRSMFGSNAEMRPSKGAEIKPLKQKFNDAVQTISKHLLVKKEIQKQLADPNNHTPIKELIAMSESLFMSIKSLGTALESWRKRIVPESNHLGLID